MKTLLLKNKLTLIGIIVGAVGGYWYYSAIGCESGTCPITSVWYNTTAYGMVLGGLFFSIFQKE